MTKSPHTEQEGREDLAGRLTEVWTDPDCPPVALRNALNEAICALRAAETEVLNAAFSDRLDEAGSPLTWKEIAEAAEQRERELGEQLIVFAYEFVREQSCGEWDDDVIAQDAKQLIAGVRALLRKEAEG